MRGGKKKKGGGGVMDETTDQCYHVLDRCKFLPKTERTSLLNRKASNMGRRQSKAVSRASLNHDLIGIALSETNKHT